MGRSEDSGYGGGQLLRAPPASPTGTGAPSLSGRRAQPVAAKAAGAGAKAKAKAGLRLGRLEVRVLEAEGLQNMDGSFGRNDAYCLVRVGQETRRTARHHDTAAAPSRHGQQAPRPSASPRGMPRSAHRASPRALG